VTKKTDHAEEGEVKLEDILKSIRGIIDNNNVFSSEVKKGIKESLEDEQDSILELTSVIEDTEHHLVSQNTKNYTETEVNKLKAALKAEQDTEQSGQSLNLLVNGLVQPLIKDWLDNNLPKIVENIVSEEIKKIIPKK
jgi:cell pole-organizing protein PopZ